ncbi:MAG: FtsX-like permease family protein [Segetibacter sp.]|nr:FtsX-like permease family protein [Segetibacter sp.]
MFKNYFKIAWRELAKSKVFSFINIFGLTIGLTTFLLIALYIFDELTFDRFHKNADNIYRVVEYKTSPQGKETKSAGAGYQVSEKAKTSLPSIKEGARLITLGRTNVGTKENTNVFYEDYTIGNPGFLTTFDFKLLQGDRNTALTAPHSVIVTEETAQKLFNTTDVLGRSIKIDADSTSFKITAVLKDFPVNSHLSFNLLFSESSIANDAFRNFINSDWNSGSFRTYLLLNDKTDAHKLETKINKLAADNESSDTKDKSRYVLQSLKDIHFYSNDIEGDSGKKGNITYIYVFSILALFVLFIACINYMNLTTARFANRAKEIAVRKVAGASRRNLVAQFLSEAFLITIIAFTLAVILVEILLPYLNAFTQKQLTLDIYSDPRIWIGIISIIIVVGLLSGMYPALFQSASKPLLLLKSKINPGKGNLSLRRSLVVFQFALSIVMIVATIIVYMQMKYVSTKDMGFDKDQLLVIDINSGKVRKGAETIKNEFAKLSQVKEVSVSSRVPGEWKDLPKLKVKNEKIQTPEGEDMYFVGVDDKFLKTYKITLVKGRNFASGSVADSSSVILNETAAKELGIKEPSEQLIEIPLDKTFTARVIGIVKDFNFQSLRQPLAPMLLGFQKNPIQNIDYFTVRVTTNAMTETLKQMDAILHNIDQSHLFEYHFLDKQWDLFYREDQIRETIFLIVAILTIIIACLGLFGLATYAAEQRIKEIGIRKVLGASVGSIVTMLSKDFLRLVLIASVIAFPIAWWTMSQWLHDFAYRIHISWWIFIVAGLIALLIALLTISFKAIKAAVANPVKSLRTE